MAFPISQAVPAALMCLVWAAPLAAQPGPAQSGQADAGIDTSVSPDCSAPASRLYRPGALPNVALALEQRRPIRALALGPFPSGGFGYGSGSSRYTARLQTELHGVLGGVPIAVEGRRLPGETTAGAPEAIMNAVMEVRPALVIWSAGAHDALARVEIEPFLAEVGLILGWMRSHDIDAVLVEPPYTAAIADDEHYSALVQGLRAVAQRQNIPMVLRYDAMRYLSDQQAASAGMQFHLHDLGRRCTPEYVAKAVQASLGARPGRTGN